MKLFVFYTVFIVITACNAQKLTTIKKIDIKKFDKNKDRLNRYIDTLDDGTINDQSESINHYDEIIKIKNSYFLRINRYYKNANLKLTGEYFYNSFKKGIWKEYDEQENLIKETDYDKGFDYKWEDLLKLLKKREVDVKSKNTTIRKDEGNWWVYYVKGIYIYNIRIDGKTGKILQDAKTEFEEGS